jgi:N-acetylmuramic acid 6-phosphate etherase
VTPFTRAALVEARRRRARAVFITCSGPAAREVEADVVVLLAVGPEVIAGSTRLKAGTATKLALNAISTAAMVRLGKVWRGRMVDLVATNAKLRARARRILVELGGVEERRARALLERAGWRVKVALAAALVGVDVAEARARLDAADGRLDRLAMGYTPSPRKGARVPNPPKRRTQS